MGMISFFTPEVLLFVSQGNIWPYPLKTMKLALEKFGHLSPVLLYVGGG